MVDLSGKSRVDRKYHVEMAIAVTWTPDRLCSEFAPAVSRFSSLLARDAADAEDLAQEVLVKAIRALPDFSPARGSMEAWLWRIALNASRDHQRATRQRERLWTRLVRAWAPSDESSPESQAIDRIESARVRKAMTTLRRRERALLALRFGADLDYREVAHVLGMSEEAARKATDRSLRRLRDGLGGTAK